MKIRVNKKSLRKVLKEETGRKKNNPIGGPTVAATVAGEVAHHDRLAYQAAAKGDPNSPLAGSTVASEVEEETSGGGTNKKLEIVAKQLQILVNKIMEEL